MLHGRLEPAGLHGCKVVVTGRRQAVLDEAVQLLQEHGVDALGLQGDVRKISDCSEWVQKTLQAYSKLSILVNCAAGMVHGFINALVYQGCCSCCEMYFMLHGGGSYVAASFRRSDQESGQSCISASLLPLPGHLHHLQHAAP